MAMSLCTLLLILITFLLCFVAQTRTVWEKAINSVELMLSCCFLGCEGKDGIWSHFTDWLFVAIFTYYQQLTNTVFCPRLINNRYIVQCKYVPYGSVLGPVFCLKCLKIADLQSRNALFVTHCEPLPLMLHPQT